MGHLGPPGPNRLDIKHLLTDRMVNAEKYSDRSSDVRTDRSEVYTKS